MIRGLFLRQVQAVVPQLQLIRGLRFYLKGQVSVSKKKKKNQLVLN